MPVDTRKGQAAKSGIPNILVITDIGNDYDDFMALMILGYYHKLEKVKIKGIVVTGDPVHERTRLALALLEHMDIDGKKVPVVCGTEDSSVANPGTDGYNTRSKKRQLPVWEKAALEPRFLVEPHNQHKCRDDYLSLGDQILAEAERNNERLRILTLACVRDLWHIIDRNRERFAKVVEHVHAQGGCTVKDNILGPRTDAKNNTDDLDAAQAMFKFIQEKNIPCTVYNKEAAFKAKFGKEVFNSNKDQTPKMQEVADYLFHVHDIQKRAYYEDSLSPDKNHRAWMNEKWFINANTSDLPEDIKQRILSREAPAEEVLPYTTVTSYDPIAALGCIQEVTDYILPKIPVEGAGGNVWSVGSNVTDEEGEELAKQIREHLERVLSPSYEKVVL